MISWILETSIRITAGAKVISDNLCKLRKNLNVKREIKTGWEML